MSRETRLLTTAPAWLAHFERLFSGHTDCFQQVTGSNRVARTASVFRHGSTVGEQLQALAVRPGKSFSCGLRFKPRSLGINFSDLKKQVRAGHSDHYEVTWLQRVN